jgi:hypothetical protein
MTQDTLWEDLRVAADRLNEAASSLKAAVAKLDSTSSSHKGTARCPRGSDADLLREEVIDVRVRVEALITRIQTS